MVAEIIKALHSARMGRTFTKADAILQSALKTLNLEKNFKVYPIHHHWKEIVGAQAAEKSSPDEVRNGTLIVSVANSVWMNELQFRSHEILFALGKMKLDFTIERIRFRLKKTKD